MLKCSICEQEVLDYTITKIRELNDYVICANCMTDALYTAIMCASATEHKLEVAEQAHQDACAEVDKTIKERQSYVKHY